MKRNLIAAAILGALVATLPSGAVHAADRVFPVDGGAIEFYTPSNNIGCIYVQPGGTATYTTTDGGPELQCDRVEPKYVRVVLTQKGAAKRIDKVGDASCCSVGNILAYGDRWTVKPFTCESTQAGLSCESDDKHGFFVSRGRITVH